MMQDFFKAFKLKYIIIILLLILFDQISKNFLINYLKTQPGMYIKLTNWFELVYAWNYGISFGWFSNYFQYSNSVFCILNSLIVIYLMYLIISTPSIIGRYGLVIIIGGAIGNLIDRFLRGAVFDFLSFHYSEYYFPAFNLADCFVNFGVGLMLISFIKSSKPYTVHNTNELESLK